MKRGDHTYDSLCVLTDIEDTLKNSSRGTWRMLVILALRKPRQESCKFEKKKSEKSTKPMIVIGLLCEGVENIIHTLYFYKKTQMWYCAVFWETPV